MKITDLYKIAVSLNADEREYWFSLFKKSMTEFTHLSTEVCFEHFVVALYANVNGMHLNHSSVIAYGAGNIAKEHLPVIQCYVNIQEIWDAYSKTEYLYNIPVVRPHFDAVDSEMKIIIFIEDNAIRYNVAALLESEGYKTVFSYREFLQTAEAISEYPNIGEYVTDKTIEALNGFVGQYAVIVSNYAAVNYSVVPKNLVSVQLGNDAAQIDETGLSKRLFDLLTLAETEVEKTKQLAAVILNAFKDGFSLAYQTEIFLRELLDKGVKTRERPIRMLDDYPYDQFAVFEAIRVTFEFACGDFQKALSAIKILRKLSPGSVPLISAECYFLVKCGHLEEALQLAREAIKKEPNGLLSNETFYQVAVTCKAEGLTVEEPLPTYDLRERFCWSGLTFALCPGFNNKDGLAEFLPCFRTLQCAANPAGDFWCGEEWVEFRKSILDGSFKYCQKNQCSNIVAGWLPKKKDCSHKEVQKLIEGDFSVIPPLEELHFSYDFHCNLKCPSCRLEIKPNSSARNAELDLLFEKNLRGLVENAKHLCLSGCGEAIISPHSKRVLQSLSREKSPELAIELRTNVFSFNPTAWNALGSGREVIRHVAASIDAASKELFERLRAPAKWDIVLKNLEYIQSLRKSGEMDLFEFHVVVQKDNIDELIDIIKMAIKYEADVITFSRLVNWRGMSEEEYQTLNPFWLDNPQHSKLMGVISKIVNLRDDIEAGQCDLTKGRKKLLINMHCVPDPNSRYDDIRVGKLKIR